VLVLSNEGAIVTPDFLTILGVVHGDEGVLVPEVLFVEDPPFKKIQIFILS